MAPLIGHAQTDPDLAREMRANYTSPRRHLAAEALQRAQNRGQIRPEVDPEAVVDQLWGARYHRMLLTGLPITDTFADTLLNNLLLGIEPRRGSFQPAPSGGLPRQS